MFLLFAFGCGGGGGGADGQTIVFEDHFEYTPASPWTPVNNWTKYANDWNIVTGGVTGNALQSNLSGVTYLINDFTDSDYEITVKVKTPVLLPNGCPFCIIGRCQNSSQFYRFSVYYEPSITATRLILEVNAGPTSIDIVTFKTGYLDTSTFYTMTLSMSGDQITGTFSDGVTTATVTGTDSTYSSGKVGLAIWNSAPLGTVLFDDFIVTTP